PYPLFRIELETRLSDNCAEDMKQKIFENYSAQELLEVKPPFVSRAPDYKVTGAAHESTLRSGKEKGYKISKKPLSKLTLKDFEKYYYNRQDDMLLYNAIKKRFEEAKEKGEKAFDDNKPFYKPKADGSNGPIVKSVKIKEPISSCVAILDKDRNKGIADNGNMIRLDMFFVPGDGYYGVPIYVSDAVEPKLPNKAVVSKKPWKEMDDENFLFSLHKNDLIKVCLKRETGLKLNIKNSTLPGEKFVKETFLYYKGFDINTARITAISIDNAYSTRFSVKTTFEKIEKYVVDPIGNYYKVKKEKRMRFNKSNGG
ncbi:MAG: type II CRISPR RNA-guided endonuclease Cas9, partial [Clostridiales bacterium]|nr:type II CRISPR RNA-guided endonuclease Cas9 [Clostridiales bacterium]